MRCDPQHWAQHSSPRCHRFYLRSEPSPTPFVVGIHYHRGLEAPGVIAALLDVQLRENDSSSRNLSVPEADSHESATQAAITGFASSHLLGFGPLPCWRAAQEGTWLTSVLRSRCPRLRRRVVIFCAVFIITVSLTAARPIVHRVHAWVTLASTLS